MKVGWFENKEKSEDSKFIFMIKLHVHRTIMPTSDNVFPFYWVNKFNSKLNANLVTEKVDDKFIYIASVYIVWKK